jgi:hypothetical protein
MQQPGYGKYVEQTIDKVPYGTIILPKTIAKTMAKEFALPITKAITVCNLKVKRLTDKGILVRLEKGAYCRYKQTVFGSVEPAIEQIVGQRLLFKEGKVIGYITGAEELNKIGLVTLLPRNIEISTNNYRAKLPKGCCVKARKPVVKVNAKNWKYLQFVDIIDNLPRFPVDATKPEEILKNYIEQHKLDSIMLITIASKYYSQKTLLRLVKLLTS